MGFLLCFLKFSYVNDFAHHIKSFVFIIHSDSAIWILSSEHWTPLPDTFWHPCSSWPQTKRMSLQRSHLEDCRWFQNLDCPISSDVSWWYLFYKKRGHLMENWRKKTVKLFTVEFTVIFFISNATLFIRVDILDMSTISGKSTFHLSSNSSFMVSFLHVSSSSLKKEEDSFLVLDLHWQNISVTAKVVWEKRPKQQLIILTEDLELSSCWLSRLFLIPSSFLQPHILYFCNVNFICKFLNNLLVKIHILRI